LQNRNDLPFLKKDLYSAYAKTHYGIFFCVLIYSLTDAGGNGFAMSTMVRTINTMEKYQVASIFFEWRGIFVVITNLFLDFFHKVSFKMMGCTVRSAVSVLS